jgi:ribosomal protein S27AE
MNKMDCKKINYKNAYRLASTLTVIASCLLVYSVLFYELPPLLPAIIILALYTVSVMIIIKWCKCPHCNESMAKHWWWSYPKTCPRCGRELNPVEKKLPIS